MTDEQAIRELVAEWTRATLAGDVERILPLMADDVEFYVPGQPVMRGRAAFETTPPYGFVKRGESACFVCSRVVVRWRADGSRRVAS